MLDRPLRTLRLSKKGSVDVEAQSNPRSVTQGKSAGEMVAGLSYFASLCLSLQRGERRTTNFRMWKGLMGCFLMGDLGCVGLT